MCERRSFGCGALTLAPDHHVGRVLQCAAVKAVADAGWREIVALDAARTVTPQVLRFARTWLPFGLHQVLGGLAWKPA